MIQGASAEQNRRFYDTYWSGDFSDRQRLWRAWWDEGYARALQWAGDLAGKRVLNLFAGHGDDARMLQQRGARVVALDFSRAGLAHLTGNPDRKAPTPLCGDAMQLPFRDATFDLVFVINGLCHTEKARTLAECRRVLRSGGKVLLIEAMRWPHVAVLARLCDPFFWGAPHRFLSVGELQRLAQGWRGLRHEQFFFASVVSIMIVRLLPNSRVVRALHRGCLRLDRPLLRAIPFLRRFAYLCVAELS